MHKRGLCRHAVSVHISVCHVCGSCQNEQTYLRNFFAIGQPHHSSYFIPKRVTIFQRNPPNGGIECRRGRQKRNFRRISGFAVYRTTVISTVRVAKCEKQSRDEWRQALSTHCGVRCPLFAQEDDEVFVTGPMLYAGDEGRSNSPWS